VSSSISSFRSELKVVLVVLVALAACEAGVRKLGPSVSLDDRHCAQIPDIAAGLARRRPPRILFLGNSLTRAGVSLDSFREQLAGTALGEANCAAVFPDNTVVSNWYYLYKCRFFY
jgi:hypothetical protein